ARSRPGRRRRKAERLTVLYDVTANEVAADHQCRLAGEIGEQLAPRIRRLTRVEIEGRRPTEVSHLARMVRNVAREDRFLAARTAQHAEMARAVARRREDTHLLADTVARLNEVGEVGVDDGLDRVVEYGRLVRIVAARPPVIVLRTAEQISCLLECRHPGA